MRPRVRRADPRDCDRLEQGAHRRCRSGSRAIERAVEVRVVRGDGQCDVADVDVGVLRHGEAHVAKHVEHAAVRAQDLRGEFGDAVGARDLGEQLQQAGPKALSLQLVANQESQLRGVARKSMTDIRRERKDASASLGDERETRRRIRGCERRDIELLDGDHAEEAREQALRRDARQKPPGGLCVRDHERPHVNRRPITEHDVPFEGGGLSRCCHVDASL